MTAELFMLLLWVGGLSLFFGIAAAVCDYLDSRFGEM